MRRLVAISAAYGAGGERVGRALAERLGVPFLDRAIPIRVAAELRVPFEEADAIEDEAPSWLERLLRGFVGIDPGGPTPLPSEALTSDDFRRETEKVLLAQCDTGAGVMLGRAAAIVLRDDPRVLKARLDGPREARLRQAIRLAGLDQDAARHALDRLDRTHADYARELYGADLHDPRLYDLTIDSTSIPLDTCVELIHAAAMAGDDEPSPGATQGS